MTRAVAMVVAAGALSLTGSGLASAATSAQSTAPSSPVAASRTTAMPDSAIGMCNNVGSKHFAKTRFLFHSALAFGAFHRYILKPLQNGGFATGAAKRVRAFAKAALAGVFVVHEVKQMVKFAEADKTLCKIVPNISGAQAALNGLIAKFKGGTANTGDVTNVSGLFDSLKTQAGGLGASIKDTSPSVPGL